MGAEGQGGNRKRREKRGEGRGEGMKRGKRMEGEEI